MRQVREILPASSNTSPLEIDRSRHPSSGADRFAHGKAGKPQ